MLSNTQLTQLFYNNIDNSVILDEVKKGRNYNQNIQNQKRFTK